MAEMAAKALRASALRSFFSEAGSREGSPAGWGMPMPGTMRGTPIAEAMEVMVQIWAVGMPARSISLVIVAPQRVPVPQVEVRMTPCTPSALRACAMAAPKFLLFS